MSVCVSSRRRPQGAACMVSGSQESRKSGQDPRRANRNLPEPNDPMALAWNRTSANRCHHETHAIKIPDADSGAFSAGTIHLILWERACSRLVRRREPARSHISDPSRSKLRGIGSRGNKRRDREGLSSMAAGTGSALRKKFLPSFLLSCISW